MRGFSEASSLVPTAASCICALPLFCPPVFALDVIGFWLVALVRSALRGSFEEAPRDGLALTFS